MENEEVKETSTKICKHCQTEIPKKAKVCPNCRKKQGGKLKWVIIAVVAIIVISSIAGNSGDKKPSDDNPEKVGEANTNEEKDSKGKKFSVGDIVETSNLKINFVSAKKYKTKNEFLQPKEGNVYYEMEFEFENTGDSDVNVSSYDFKCYADGYDMEQKWFDGFDLNANLSPGKKTKGSVFFEIPKKSKEVTLEYETNFWTENKVIFKVK